MLTCIHIYTHAHTHLHTHMHIHMHTTHSYIYIHTHTHTQTHAYTHTHTHTRNLRSLFTKIYQSTASPSFHTTYISVLDLEEVSHDPQDLINLVMVSQLCPALLLQWVMLSGQGDKRQPVRFLQQSMGRGVASPGFRTRLDANTNQKINQSSKQASKLSKPTQI